MKKLLLLSLILFTGCGRYDFYRLVGVHKFVVGDCIILSLRQPEVWEKAEYIILELGIDSYRVKSVDGHHYAPRVSYGNWDEGLYQKVPCPNLEGA